MPLRFVLSEHAKDRIQHRLFDSQSARRVINNPKSLKHGINGKMIATGTSLDGRMLTIVYRSLSKNQVLIITGYYEDKV